MLVIYGFVASVLPVWLLLAPRDYLSTFMKIGVIIGSGHRHRLRHAGDENAGGLALHRRQRPGVRRRPVPVPVHHHRLRRFPASTRWSPAAPRPLVERESHIRFIGYGAMLMESFVAIMALICASVLDPGVYFAMNSPAALIGTTVENASQVINSWGFIVTPETLALIAKEVGENSILSRAGGAPTFAVGMAHIISARCSTAGR